MFKAVFTQPDQAASHLRWALPPEVVRHLDLAKLREGPGEFIDDELSASHTDLLLETATTRGEPVLVYLLWEHQSTPESWTPFRNLAYLVRIWQRWLDANPGATRLPVILPVVLYHGAERWRAPLRFAELLDLTEAARADLARWLVDFRHVFVDLGEIDDEALQGRALGRMALLLMKHARDGNLWERLPGWMDVLQAVRSESGGRAVAIVMRYVMEVERGPPTPKVRKQLVEGVGGHTVEGIMSWAQQLRDEGREAGRREGREEARVEQMRVVLERLLHTRFGAVPEPVVLALREATIEQLDAWVDRVLVAESPEAVVAE